MILANPLNHHIVTLCNILDAIAHDPKWKSDNIQWLAVAVSLMAGRQGDNVEAAYPVTTRKVIGVVGEELFNEMLANPGHTVLATERAKRLIAEKVFGEMVAQAHELVLSSESEWHESHVISEQFKTLMGGMYYGVRHVATYDKVSFRSTMLAVDAYMQ